MNNAAQNHRIKVNVPLLDLQSWGKFISELKWENRFALSDQTEGFVENIIQYAGQCKVTPLPQGSTFFRARVHELGHPSMPFPLSEMVAPPCNLSGHGRINPRGIPYLYLASDQTTAISEVRPWVGCNLTIAHFELTDDCEFINFSLKNLTETLTGDGNQGAGFFWNQVIAWFFSAPFDPRDDFAYLPTQYLAEKIKRAGFSGLIYDSALSMTGYNVAIFDEQLAKPMRRAKVKVTSMEVDFRSEEISE